MVEAGAGGVVHKAAVKLHEAEAAVGEATLHVTGSLILLACGMDRRCRQLWQLLSAAGPMPLQQCNCQKYSWLLLGSLTKS